MILRIEKHFKAEQAARKKAEELLQQSIAAEMDAKNKLEDVLKKRSNESRMLEEERNAIRKVRGVSPFPLYARVCVCGEALNRVTHAGGGEGGDEEGAWGSWQGAVPAGMTGLLFKRPGCAVGL